jgi:hypothetical protein
MIMYLFTYTNPGSFSERQVRVVMSLALRFFTEALWVEILRLGEELRVIV